VRLIALLRAINVGGRVVKMDRLRAVVEAQGFGGVETFIASGNVVFEGRANQARKAERAIERALLRELGYQVATFIRTGAELTAVAAHEPFAPRAVEHASTFSIGFLKDGLDKGATTRLMALRTAADDFHLHGREVYWLSTLKQSESKFNNAMFERVTRVPATFRSITTVRKLVAKYPTE